MEGNTWQSENYGGVNQNCDNSNSLKVKYG